MEPILLNPAKVVEYNVTLKARYQFAAVGTAQMPNMSYTYYDQNNNPYCGVPPNGPDYIDIDNNQLIHNGEAQCNGGILHFFIDGGKEYLTPEEIAELSCADRLTTPTGASIVKVGIGVTPGFMQPEYSFEVGELAANMYGYTIGSVDVTATAIYKTKITYEVWGEYTESGGYSTPDSDMAFWCGFPYSDPYEPAKRTFRIYYVKKSVTWCCEYEGETYGSYTTDYSSNTDRIYDGLSIDETIRLDDFANVYVPPGGSYPELSFSASGSVSGAGSFDADLDEYDVSGGLTVNRKILSGPNVELQTKGWYTEGWNACGFDVGFVPHSAGYSGVVKNCSGQARQNVKVRYSEGKPENELLSYTDSNGAFAKSFSYKGSYSSYGFDAAHSFSDLGPEYHSAGLIDLQNSGEFNYDNQIFNTGSQYGNWRAFSDGRLMFKIPELAWEDAVTFSYVTHKERMQILAETEDLSAYTISPAGKATLSKDTTSGRLKVIVAADAPAEGVTISRSFTTKPTLTGARFVNLDFTASVSDKVGFKINSVSKDVGVSADVNIKNSESIDLVGNYENTEAVDTGQSLLFGDTVGFGWGINDVDTLEISKLKAGATYVFKGLNQVIHGTPVLYMYDGGFVGDRPGDGRGSDAHSLIEDASLYFRDEGANITKTYHKSRKGIIIADGFPIAEIYGMLHEQVDLTSGTYYNHYPIDITDTDNLLFPLDGLVDYTNGTSPPLTSWDESDYFICDVPAGTYTFTGGTCDVSLAPAVDFVSAPYEENISLSGCIKHLRGDMLVRVFNPDGSTADHVTITCKLYDSSASGEDAVSTTTHTTDSNGCFLMRDVRGPTVCKGYVSSVSNGNLTYVLNTLTSLEDLTGHTIYLSPNNSDFAPTQATITDMTVGETTATVTIDTAPASGNVPTENQPVWILKDYTYELTGTGEDNEPIHATVSARNRTMTFVTIKGVVVEVVYGLLYRKSDGALICACRGSTDGALRCDHTS